MTEKILSPLLLCTPDQYMGTSYIQRLFDGYCASVEVSNLTTHAFAAVVNNVRHVYMAALLAERQERLNEAKQHARQLADLQHARGEARRPVDKVFPHELWKVPSPGPSGTSGICVGAGGYSGRVGVGGVVPEMPQHQSGDHSGHTGAAGPVPEIPQNQTGATTEVVLPVKTPPAPPRRGRTRQHRGNTVTAGARGYRGRVGVENAVPETPQSPTGARTGQAPTDNIITVMVNRNSDPYLRDFPSLKSINRGGWEPHFSFKAFSTQVPGTREHIITSKAGTDRVRFSREDLGGAIPSAPRCAQGWAKILEFFAYDTYMPGTEMIWAGYHVTENMGDSDRSIFVKGEPSDTVLGEWECDITFWVPV